MSLQCEVKHINEDSIFKLMEREGKTREREKEKERKNEREIERN